MTRQEFIRNMREYGYEVTVSNPPPTLVLRKKDTGDGISWNQVSTSSPQNLDRFTDVEFKFYLNIQRMYEAGLI